MKSGDTGQRQTGAPSDGGEGCEGLHSAVPTAPLSERGLSPGKRIAQPPRTTSNTMRKTGRELSGLALRVAIDFPRITANALLRCVFLLLLNSDTCSSHSWFKVTCETEWNALRIKAKDILSEF